MRALAALLLLAACTVSEAPAQVEAPAPIAPPAAPAPAPVPAALTLACAGAFTQGGVAVCRTLPGAQISIDGADVGAADAQGWALIGFNRQYGASARVIARANGAEASHTFEIVPREFDIQRIDGLPPQTVTPTDPAVLARIQREAAMKAEGFASEADITGFLDGFIWPVEGGRISGRWGGQRILNGVPNTPHFGVDIAVPTGTPIRAPAAGVVSFANPDMHYEGGLVFIDHGHGLITMYLHMSRLDVQAGQRVEQGQVIGAVGATGRATGPHLCWRMRWRERQLDPTVAIDGLAAARAQLLSAP
ncbi:MAG: M23 family metallopeptidase [Hyphomonadaceae bacterium]|nr:M23 family metallopeptidase [Hyphomonadaceae bacterium]MBX3511720.1 M23 family metallopeptidase [Hyphomonadaceae bacterium]